MEKPFLVFEKKLDQLQSRIRQLSSSLLPAGEDADGRPSSDERRLDINGDEIRTQIDFLNTLLAAEMECHPDNTPHRLLHISGKLDALQNAFRRWEEGSAVPTGDFLDDGFPVCACSHECLIEPEAAAAAEEDYYAPEEPVPELLVPVETEVADMERRHSENISEKLSPTGDLLDVDHSVCHCGHECFREQEAQEEDYAPEPVPEPEFVVPAASETETETEAEAGEDSDSSPEGDDEMEAKLRRLRSGRRCGIIMAVVALVMGLVASFHLVEEEAAVVYLVPT